MEEEAPSRRSVAELAGRFKGSAHPHDAAGNETEKPVRRRPPRSLQLPKTHGDEQELPGVTSPLPAKTKRNSALIEKLQANLTLSPTALLPSPKSPGFRLMPPAFTPPSPGSAPVSMATTSSTVTPTSPVAATTTIASSSAFLLTEEEGPVSFEAPPTAAEGSILSNSSIKGRARHSIRRRPPSRRHRKSSCGENVGIAIEGEDASLSPNTPEDKTTGRGEEEGKTDEVKKDETDASPCPEKNESHQDEGSKISAKENEKKVEGSMEGEVVDGSSSVRKEDEEEEEEKKNSVEKQKEDLTEGATITESKEKENNEETMSQSSAS